MQKASFQTAQKNSAYASFFCTAVWKLNDVITMLYYWTMHASLCFNCLIIYWATAAQTHVVFHNTAQVVKLKKYVLQLLHISKSCDVMSLPRDMILVSCDRIFYFYHIERPCLNVWNITISADDKFLMWPLIYCLFKTILEISKATGIL